MQMIKIKPGVREFEIVKTQRNSTQLNSTKATLKATSLG